MNLIVAADERLTRHLVHALGLHVAWCRRNAVVPPPDLVGLLVTLTDSDGPQRPAVAIDEPISDGVCVTYATAARMLGVSERTVRRMVADGRLPVVPVGRRRLVPVAALRGLADAAA